MTYPAVCSKGVTLLGNADRADRKPPCARNRTSGWNVRWPAIRAWGQDHSRILDRRAANTRAASKAPERPVRCPSIPFVALRPERRARSAPASRTMTDDDHNLDDLKDRLSRGFGVQVREDLQVRAEIVIQPEEGRWVFTPNELSDPRASGPYYSSQSRGCVARVRSSVSSFLRMSTESSGESRSRHQASSGCRARNDSRRAYAAAVR